MIVAAESGGRPLALPALLVGRARERARLRDVLAAALAGRGGLALLGGDLGIGKTTLAQALGREAAERGAAVHLCQCYEAAQPGEHSLWLDLLADWSPDRAPHRAADGDPARPGATGVAAQVREFLVAEARRGPLCLILEDLHWADAASLEALRVLGRALPGLPVLIVGTYRDYEITPRHPLYRLLPLLAREVAAHRLDLGPLDDDALRTLLWARYGLPPADEGRLAAALRARAAGCPLYIEELLRAAEEAGILFQEDEPRGPDRPWRVGDLAALPLPPLLKQMLDARIARLGGDDARLLAVAAALGPTVPLDLWGRVAGIDDDPLFALVERAAEARLVAETDDGRSLRFRHPLIREALCDGLSAARRRRWHQRAAEALAAAFDAGDDPAPVAEHFRLAADGRAVPWLTQAGELALRRGDRSAAAGHFGAAADLLRDSGADELARALLLRRLARLRRRDDPAAGLDRLREAEAITAARRDRALALLLAGDRALLRAHHGEWHRAIAEAEEALAADGDLPEAERQRLRAWQGEAGDLPLWGLLAATLAVVGRHREARAAAGRVLAAPPPGDAPLDGSPEGDAALALGVADAARGALAEAHAAFARARAAYRVGGDHRAAGVAALRELDAVLLLAPDDLAARARLAAEADEALARAGDPPGLGSLPLLALDGRWAEARAVAEAAGRDPATARRAALPLATIARAQGDAARAWSLIAQLLPHGPATAPGDAPLAEALATLALAAHLALDGGELATARTWLQAADRWLAWAGDGAAGGAVAGAGAVQLAWAAHDRAAGDPAGARARAEVAGERAAAPRQPLALLAAARLLGELATAAGDFDAATAHLATALALADACAAPYERALTLLARAELHVASAADRPDAVARPALADLDDARARLAALGAAPALARADALVAGAPADGNRVPTPAPPAAAGTRYPSAGVAAGNPLAGGGRGALAPAPAPPAASPGGAESPKARPGSGPLAALPGRGPHADGHGPTGGWLTPRELEVLRLIAGGLSNREIAAKLFLSVRTAERHIANIYKKIGAHSKADATAYAFSNGLL